MVSDSASSPVLNYRGGDLLILTILVGILFGFMLGSRPLAAPDEARYSEIPREMVASGDYLTPRLDGVKYFEKPVLFYWLQSVSIKLFGLSEWSLRLWTALLGLVGVLATYATADRLYGRRAGWLSSIVLATCFLYYGLSRTVTLDMAVSTFLTLGFFAFLLGTRAPPGAQRRWLLWSFYALAALATLTKGLIGIVLPALVIGTWILMLGQWRLLRSIYLPSGILLFLAIAAPWHVLVSHANPGFAWFYFVHEHLQRYLTTVHNRYEPAWYFIPILLIGLLPWTVFLWQAVRFNLAFRWRDRRQHADVVFLVLWAGLVFVFFSGSDSKLIPYILPVFPPIALLIGRYLAAAWDRPAVTPIRPAFWALLPSAILVAAALVTLPRFWHTGVGRAVHAYLDVMAIIFLVGSVVTLWLSRGGRVRAPLVGLAVTSALMLSVLSMALPSMPFRSLKDVAITLRESLQPGDEVVSYRTYYQDLPFYLERNVGIIDWKGELEFGSSIENVSDRLMGDGAFWSRWSGPATIYMVTSRDSYDQLRKEGRPNLYLLVMNDDTVVLRNKKD